MFVLIGRLQVHVTYWTAADNQDINKKLTETQLKRREKERTKYLFFQFHMQSVYNIHENYLIF